MGEIRRIVDRGFAAAAVDRMECSSQEELMALVPMTVARFEEIVRSGAIVACAEHPGRFRASEETFRKSLRLMRADPEMRRRMG